MPPVRVPEADVPATWTLTLGGGGTTPDAHPRNMWRVKKPYVVPLERFLGRLKCQAFEITEIHL